MADYIGHFFFAFILFLISANGRSLHKNYTSEKTNDISSNSLFSNNNIKVGAVSRVTNDSYTGKTNYNDVLGLVALCKNYPWLREENEDPCVRPIWRWIQCNFDDKPRIVAINLYNKILSGTLPDFSSMDALQSIDLSYNVLSGPIPSFLGTFPDLEELNLEYNYFTGQVPDILACNTNLKLRVNNNYHLYTSSACPIPDIDPYPPANRTTTYGGYEETSSTTMKLPVILGAVLLASVVFRIFVGICAYFRHKCKVAAAIAEASRTEQETPTEEMLINARPNNISP